MIPSVIRIPHSLDLHDHQLVQSHSIILQTKASCFPPFFLLRDLVNSSSPTPKFDVIDATAAPGNKTTFLGDILRKRSLLSYGVIYRGTVFAFDRDPKRYKLLKSRCESYGVNNVLPD